MMFALLAAAALAAMRLVSVSPAVTADLFAIGAGPQVVAIDAYAKRPKQIAGLPRIGGVYDVNVEGVLGKRPTLVAYQELDTPAIESMRSTGVRVVRVPGLSLADDWTAIRTLGELTDHQSAADALVAHLQARLDRSSARVAPKRKLRVLLLLWPDPIWSVARGSFVDDLLARANLVNVMHDAPRPWPMLSPEIIARSNPDLIIVDDNEHFSLPVDRMPWKLLAAVREHRVAHLHEKLDCGPYIADLFDDIIRAVAPYR
jgi:ABC-type Fe3+-hydroxamate transport system substrate-binding protein